VSFSFQSGHNHHRLLHSTVCNSAGNNVRAKCCLRSTSTFSVSTPESRIFELSAAISMYLNEWSGHDTPCSQGYSSSCSYGEGKFPCSMRNLWGVAFVLRAHAAAPLATTSETGISIIILAVSVPITLCASLARLKLPDSEASPATMIARTSWGL
jgi:hypothetical protein